MKHLDLFSGIGGFAYAVDQVWENAEHIFCDNDKFCQQVLKKHWSNSKIYEDIRTITDTNKLTLQWEGGNKEGKLGQATGESDKNRKTTVCGTTTYSGPGIDLLTGGFPCQPFSQAGRRKGTGDDRYLWPEMLRVIRLTQPTRVIAENVAGLLTISEGLVFEQVCTDLEKEGYEVQPFIIPAVAVNAPHRRDRVWIIAHAKGLGGERGPEEIRGEDGRQVGELHTESHGADSDAPDSERKGYARQEHKARQSTRYSRGSQSPDWSANWVEVATELCRVDDGLSEGLDITGWSKAGHRVQRLKSLGNSIVPQVVVEIMKGIKTLDKGL